MLSVTNPLTNAFKPYVVSSATNQSQSTQQQQQMGQPGSMSYQTSNMPLYMQNMYGLHGYIAQQQQQQQQLLAVDPQQAGYTTNNDQSATTPPRNDEKDALSYNVQALLSGTTLHGLNGLMHSGMSGGSKASSGPLSSGSMTSSGEQARSTPSLNSECSNSMGSGLNNTESTPSGGSSGEADITGSAKKRTHSGQIKGSDRDKDSAYWEKRRKNNESARRSREARRMKEEQIAMRVVYLEQENLQLRTEVSLLRGEIDKLRCMLYNV